MKLFLLKTHQFSSVGRVKISAGMQIWDRWATSPDAFGVVLVTKTSV